MSCHAAAVCKRRTKRKLAIKLLLRFLHAGKSIEIRALGQDLTLFSSSHTSIGLERLLQGAL
jgi:hypothetical protein